MIKTKIGGQILLPVLAVIGLLLGGTNSVKGQTVDSVFAGTGTVGFSGDGAAATAAKLKHPGALCFDRTGNMYFVDGTNNRIRKITSSGTISTIAGTGAIGVFNPSDTVASSTNLGYPAGIACDINNNIYYSDQNLNVIRKISPSGQQKTVCGTGALGNGSDTGLATTIALKNPIGVAVDKIGRVYFSDSKNNKIRRIDTNGRISTIYSGCSNPQGLTVDTAGNVYLADYGNNRICKLAAGTFSASVVIGSGDLKFPRYVAVDSVGNIFVTVKSSNVVNEFNSTGSSIGTLSGADLDGALGVAIYNSRIYITGEGDNRIHKLAGSLSTISITGDATICRGGTAHYSVTSTSIFTAKYKWLINGDYIAATGIDDTSSTFSYSGLRNNDRVSCVLLNSAGGSDVKLSNTIVVSVAVDSLPHLQ